MAAPGRRKWRFNEGASDWLCLRLRVTATMDGQIRIAQHQHTINQKPEPLATVFGVKRVPT